MLSIIGREYRARAEQWLPSLIARIPGVTSADKAYATFRDIGMYIPRSYVRSAWGEIIRGQSRISIIHRMGHEDRVPRDWMQETSFEYAERYNTIVNVGKVRDAKGFLVDQFVTVQSGENLTIGEILSTATQSAFDYGIDTTAWAYDPQIESVLFSW